MTENTESSTENPRPSRAAKEKRALYPSAPSGPCWLPLAADLAEVSVALMGATHRAVRDERSTPVIHPAHL